MEVVGGNKRRHSKENVTQMIKIASTFSNWDRSDACGVSQQYFFPKPSSYFQFYMEKYGWHPAFSSASTEFEIETQESNIHS